MFNNDTLLFLVLIGIFIVVGVLAYVQQQKQKQLFEEQAQKRNGRIEKGSFLASDRLILPVRNLELRIYTVPGGKNRPPKTVAELGNGGGRFPKIRVGRNTLFQKTLETFGQERFRLGDEDFDQAFVIQTEDESSARRVLSYEIQKNLLELVSKNPSLETGPKQFRWVILQIPKNTEEYDLFIETGLAVLQKLA
jgi:hypothetical protein